MVEEVNGGDNSIDSKNTNLDRRAIHIHGGMEHNLAKYAKHYSYSRSTKILGGSELTKLIDYNRRDILGHWLTDVENKLYFKLGTIVWNNFWVKNVFLLEAKTKKNSKSEHNNHRETK